MNIAVNATFLSKRLTGVGVFTLEVIRELLAIEPDPVIFTPHPELFPQATVCIRTPLRFQGSLNTSGNIGRFFYCQSVMPEIMQRLRVDVLYCPILEYPFLSKWPTVVTVHDLHPIYFPDQFGASGFHFRLALRLAERRGHWIMAPSHHVKRELIARRSKIQSRISHFTLGYNHSLFQPQPAADRDRFLRSHGIRGPYLLFVGSLFPYKNFRVLLDAFRLIRDRVPHQLVALGRTEVAPQAPTPEPGVKYLDYVPAADLPKFYTYADLYVQPSLAEGFGLTVVEAMACGVPVLASTAGSLPEVVADAGLLFDPMDSNALAQLILRVLGDNELKRDLAVRGGTNIRRFDWAQTARQVATVLHRAAGR